MTEQLITAIGLFAIVSIGGWAVLYIDLKGNIKSKKRFEQERAHASGRVVGLIPREHRYGRRNRTTFWHPVVSFIVDGREYKVESKDGLYEGDISVGDEVEVLYDSDDPTYFHLGSYPESDRRSSKSLMCFGIVWILIAVIAAVLGARMI